MDRTFERRIALNGQAYTWPQFVEAYGGDAERRWNDAYQRSIFRRIAVDGQSGAPQPADENADVRRIALDGHAYTWPEYVEVYGEDAQRCWDDAYERGVATEVFGDSDASQLAVHASASGAEETTAQWLPSVCTFQEIQEMQPVQGMGGKVACAKQRELRQVCFENEVFEIDVTETWPEWRAVLRALPENMQQLIIGHGIARVKFRLLQGVRDHNYAKKDTGERHVFEILRVDTSAVHLHYHKNGSLDDPVLVDPIVMPQNANSGASQPTLP